MVRALVIQGHNIDELAECLSCSRNTVKRHLQNIYDKLGVDSLVKLYHFALVKKLVKQ